MPILIRSSGYRCIEVTMRSLTGIVLSVLFLACNGCITGMVVQEATTRPVKSDQTELVRAYGRNDGLILHVNGSLAGRKGDQFTIDLDQEWLIDTGSDYFQVKRSKISEGYRVPGPEWSEVSAVRVFGKTSAFRYRGKGCYLEQECASYGCEPEIRYRCFDPTRGNYLVRRRFHIEAEHGFPPLYKLLIVPLTIPADVITLPFQIMMLKAASNIH